ncbi:hypothetical protein AGMMS49983_22100 [Clostridia bacterium]|nr:hypothetical protein AGMMS49983_22100 [Clostridia bacterium]
MALTAVMVVGLFIFNPLAPGGGIFAKEPPTPIDNFAYVSIPSDDPEGLIPEYYTRNITPGTPDVYAYKNTGEENLYRVYGYIDTGAGDADQLTLGFYASTPEGIPGGALIDQGAEAAGQYAEPIPDFIPEAPASESGGSRDIKPLASDFIAEAPASGSVPEYYTAIMGTTGLYNFRILDGSYLYRIYGSYLAAPAAWYASDSDGAFTTDPPTAIDAFSTGESNNAFNSGTVSNIAQDLVPNQAYIYSFELSDWTDGTPDQTTTVSNRWDNDISVVGHEEYAAGFEPEGWASGNTITPGADTGPQNGIVRSFDSANYTLLYVTALQNQEVTTYFEQGYLYLRFVIPDTTPAEATFDLAGMRWMLDPVLTTDTDVTGSSKTVFLYAYTSGVPGVIFRV